MIAVQDILDIINNNPLVLDTSDKLILRIRQEEKKPQVILTNNFKKYLLINYLNQKKNELLKTFSQMYQNEECAKRIYYL